MFSKPLPFVLLSLGCITAAAGGAYVATRHNSEPMAATSAAPSVPPAATTLAAPAPPQPVAETEAPVTSAKAETPVPAEAVPSTPRHAVTARHDTTSTKTAPSPVRSVRPEPPAARTVPQTGANAPARSSQPDPQPAADPIQPPPAAEPARAADPPPEPARVPQFEEVILPAMSVVGLQVETFTSSERARVEDRVEARVTRDVLAGGRVAIPAGSRVLGSVMFVERGGKVKTAARLGVRFHTLVLGDGSEVPLQTEAIYREGQSPAGDSAKKIGGAAIGGAILGAILGGGKGAAIGGATGAAGGTAAAIAGDRNAAVLSRGEVVTAKLSSPATITVERRE
jgi:type IV secretory pathway VirB10-like protein